MSATLTEKARLLGRARTVKKTAAARINGKLGGRPVLSVSTQLAGKRRVRLRKEAEGGYSVRCPSLPGCYSQGETREEALANIAEAIELQVEAMIDNKIIVPADPAFATE
jgi:predicted RNase H-like HicB family nuclease